MPYITSVERLGREEGLRQGLQQGLPRLQQMVIEALDERLGNPRSYFRYDSSDPRSRSAPIAATPGNPEVCRSTSSNRHSTMEILGDLLSRDKFHYFQTIRLKGNSQCHKNRSLTS